MGGKPQHEGEKYSSNISDHRLAFRICKEFLQPDNKKAKNSILKRGKDLNTLH